MRQLHITLLMIVLTVTASRGQSARQDTLPALSVPGAVLRSVLLPGWGQIYQERLLAASLFYGASAIFYYRAFFHLYHYDKGGNKAHLRKFNRHIRIAVFSHALSILDAGHIGYTRKPKGWQGTLLSDQPPKSPWGATLRSAIIPGWGQIYNESYIKAAAYFIVDGYLFYKIRQADISYRDTRDTKFRDRRSKYSWYFGLAYAITMADAYAGAYLYKFNKAMRLTFAPVVFDDFTGISCHVVF